MASTINASTSAGLVTTADTSGVLVLQSNGTTAVTISGTTATFAGPPTATGAGSVATNTAYGTNALSSNTTGSLNTAIGYQAGQLNTTGAQNVFVGHQAGQGSISATNVVAVGHQAASGATGSGITAIGTSAAQVSTGDDNIAVGAAALLSTTSGAFNTAVGRSALRFNTTASNNTAVGFEALKANTTGSNNTAVGYVAGTAVTTGVQNTTLGRLAGTAITVGNSNTAVGGINTLYSVTTGNYNSAYGAYVGVNLISGERCAYFGYDITCSSTSVSNEYVFGAGLTGKGANTAFIGGSSGVYNQGNTTTFTTTSDQRLKKNIVDNNIGLEKLAQIQVRNFEYRTEEEITELPTHTAIKKAGVQLGVIAQELQAILPDCVKQESTGVLSVDPDNLTWYMVNAIKELKAEIDTLKGTK